MHPEAHSEGSTRPLRAKRDRALSDLHRVSVGFRARSLGVRSPPRLPEVDPPMRPALPTLYAIVGLLSVAVAVLWIERDRGAPTAPPQVQVHEQRSTDGGGIGALDSSTTT